MWPEVSRKYILALVTAGKTSEAIAQARMAIERAPTDVLLQNLLGVAYLNARQPEMAAEAFRRALAIDPQNATATQGLKEADQLPSSRLR